MFELCAISDSVSDDLSQAASVIAAAGLPCIELQSVWKKPVGDLSAEELETAKGIVDGAGLRVACLSHRTCSVRCRCCPLRSTTRRTSVTWTHCTG
jgi:hypothetical protein